MISNGGEPNLSFHTCRFIVYISTLAKPIGIYLTLLFSIERLFTKILSKFLLRTNNYRQLSQRLYTLFIVLGLISIFSIRLYEVLKFVPRNQSVVQQPSDPDIDPRLDIIDTNDNSTDRNISFKYCFNSMNIDTYAKFLSFYVIQYWFEGLALGVIILVLLIITIHRCFLSRSQEPQGLIRGLSVNTKLYLSLSSCFIASEVILLFLHLIVDDVNNNNTDLQLLSLQFMLFAFNFRCIVLPLVVCMTTCDPLKQLLYELFIIRPYLENIDENDSTDAVNGRPEPFSSPQRTSNKIQQKFRRAFTKNHNNTNDYFDNDESQAEL
jgi:hypothetical protein